MGITAVQTTNEWLSDILAAMGGTAGGSTSTQQVMGAIADTSAAGTTKPVQIGTVTAGGNAARVVSRTGSQYQATIADANIIDFLPVVLMAGSWSSGTGSWTPVNTGSSSDGVGVGKALMTNATGVNGAGTADKWRNNGDTTIVSSAARTATTNSSDQTNYNGRGVTLFLNVTVNPGGGETLTFNLQVKDPVSGNYVTVASSGAIAVFGSAAGATGTEVIQVMSGAAETAALTGWTTQALVLCRTWRVNIVHSAASSWTYSVGACINV